MVRQLTGRRRNPGTTDRISADTLNQQYTKLSSYPDYQPPEYRHTAACKDMDIVSEWQVFKLLDALTATTTGIDLLPSWFLCTGALLLQASYSSIQQVHNNINSIPSMETCLHPTSLKVCHATPGF